MRFCMITTFYPPYHFGGDAIFVHALANELARRDHHVEVIHCKDAYRLLARRELEGRYENHPNVKVHGLESRFGWLSPLASQQTGWPIFKTGAIKGVLENEFDVIHYHNVSLVGGPKALAMGDAVKLYTPHEFWLVCPTHMLLKDNRKLCTHPCCLICTLKHHRPPQWWRYSNALPSAVRHVDRFLVPSRFSIEMHRARGLELPMVHLPNFLPSMAPSEGPTSEAPRLPNDRPYFLFVGRLERLKGLQTVIPAFRALPRAQLLIVGTGEYEGQLRTLANGADNIHFLGHLRRDELRRVYAGATALVIPSICYEVSPLVVIEAFCQATPVIARRIGGLAENIEDSGGGLAFDDESSLIQAVELLSSNPSLRDDLGQAGYQAYLRYWTPESYMRRYIEIIEEIVASRNTKAGVGTDRPRGKSFLKGDYS